MPLLLKERPGGVVVRELAALRWPSISFFDVGMRPEGTAGEHDLRPALYVTACVVSKVHLLCAVEDPSSSP